MFPTCAMLVQESTQQRHLILNIDINKTIIVSDAIQGKSCEDVANHVLSDTSWGTVNQDGWSIAVDTPSVARAGGWTPRVLQYNRIIEVLKISLR